MSTELIQASGTDIAPADSKAHQMRELMAAAIGQGADGVEALRQLMALQREEEDRQAARDFAAAFAAFQAECPTIVRTKIVPDKSGREKYRYAPLEAIVPVVRPILSRHGLSYTWDTDYTDGTAVVCTLTHAGGGSKSSRVRLPGIQILYANSAQNESGVVTMGRRISLINVLGLATADEDIDAADAEPPPPSEPITDEQAADLQAFAEEVGADKSAFLHWLGTRAGQLIETWADIPADYHAVAVHALEQKKERA